LVPQGKCHNITSYARDFLGNVNRQLHLLIVVVTTVVIIVVVAATVLDLVDETCISPSVYRGAIHGISIC
jgi:hypothetical protein